MQRERQMKLYLTAKYPLMHSSTNQRKGAASTFPPMIITISWVSLMSGSNPRFPPGELSNMKPKSGRIQTEGWHSYLRGIVVWIIYIFLLLINFFQQKKKRGKWMHAKGKRKEKNIKQEANSPIWMMCPAVSNMILPLCLSLICSKKPTREYAAMDLTKLDRACWKEWELSSPYTLMKYSYIPVSVLRPNWSRDLALGTHSITPHWNTQYITTHWYHIFQK